MALRTSAPDARGGRGDASRAGGRENEQGGRQGRATDQWKSRQILAGEDDDVGRSSIPHHKVEPEKSSAQLIGRDQPGEDELKTTRSSTAARRSNLPLTLSLASHWLHHSLSCTIMHISQPCPPSRNCPLTPVFPSLVSPTPSASSLPSLATFPRSFARSHVRDISPLCLRREIRSRPNNGVSKPETAFDVRGRAAVWLVGWSRFDRGRGGEGCELASRAGGREQNAVRPLLGEGWAGQRGRALGGAGRSGP